MRKKDTFLIVILIGILLICTGIFAKVIFEKKDSAESNEDTITNFTWYINYEWYKDVWGDSVVAEAITDKTHVKIDFRTPVGNSANTLDTLIASDDLPDLITLGYWDPQLKTLIENDMVYPLNELADKYCPEFNEVSDPYSVKWYTSSDGNIYCYPNSSCSYKDYLDNTNSLASNQAFIVRKDIYEAIGSPDMTSPEGFMQAIRDAAAMYPEVDGEPLIPFEANFYDEFGDITFDYILQNFLAVPYEKNNEFYNRNLDPEFLSWLKTFRQLNEEGYISPEIFMDERTQITEKILKGRYFCMFYQWTDMEDQQKEIYEKNPERVYMAVDGPRNSNGDDPVLPISAVQGWTVTLISKKCKDPEKAIEFMTFLMSEEGQKLTYLGVEGKTYDMVDGRPVIKEEVKELLERDRNEYNSKYGADNTYWMLQDNIMQLKWQQDLIPPVQQMKEYTYDYAAYTGQYSIAIPEDTVLGNRYQKHRKLWAETLKKLVLSESDEDFDTLVEYYKEESEAIGMDQVYDEITKQMNESKEKMGIED
ncbi:MAG: extracellular solute-binding protein [Eubacterium sp.]|nr:extracellular solute-binding protein [Eubacterium sp.]